MRRIGTNNIDRPNDIPRICNANVPNKCDAIPTHWMEIETNLTLACDEHFESAKYSLKENNSKVYKEGDLPSNQDELNKLVYQLMGEITHRLKDRGIKDPRAFAKLEQYIYGQITNIPPKKYYKLIKDYAKLGANDKDIKDLDQAYANLNFVNNKQKILAQPLQEELYKETEHGIVPSDQESKEIQDKHFDENHKVNEEGFCGECKVYFLTKDQIDKREINPEQDSKLITELLIGAHKADNPKETLYNLGKRVGFTIQEHREFEKLLEIAQQIHKKHPDDPELERDIFSKHTLEFVQSQPTATRKLKLEENLYPPDIIKEFNDCPQCKGRFDIISDGETEEEVQKNLGNHMLKFHPIYAVFLKKAGRDIFKMDVNFQPRDEKLNEFYQSAFERIPESAQQELENYIEKIHYMKLTSDEKIVKVAEKGYQLKHTHEKHKVDEFDYCEICKYMYVNGKPRNPNLPSFYKRELTNCKGCMEVFKHQTNSKEEMKRDWEIHFANAHPKLVEWNKKNNLDLPSIKFKIVLPSDHKTKEKPQYREYYSAVAFLKKFKITSRTEYKFFLKSSDCVADISPKPDQYYDEWKDWANYLTCKIYDYRKDHRAFTPERLEEFRIEFLKNWQHYSYWTDGMVTDLLRSLGLFNHEDKRVRQLASDFMDMWHNLDTRADLYLQLSKTRFDMQQGNRTVVPVDETATKKNQYLKRSYTQIIKSKSKGLMYEEPDIGVHEIIVNANQPGLRRACYLLQNTPGWYRSASHADTSPIPERPTP